MPSSSADPFESFQHLVGRSASMREVYSLIHSLRSSGSTVLIQGESGTGKEMVARAIHETSSRSAKPFMVINCAAIPEGLLESELFGHKRGSFTGAVVDKKGFFEEADGGTLFLDEIGEVTASFQVKLLRVLQDGEFKRVGETESRYTDVRLIAATNKNLYDMVQCGRFREDLFYRLNVISMVLPPLRERIGDIPLLAYHFLSKYNSKFKKGIVEIASDAMQAMQHYTWPGNIRELENVVERCIVLTDGLVIRAKDLPTHLLSKTFYLEDQKKEDFSMQPYHEAKQKALAMFNKAYIQHLLKKTGGNISVASYQAGMDRSNFKKIIKKYHINVRDFGSSS